MRRSIGGYRGTLYDITTLALRLGVGLLFTRHAWRSIGGGPVDPLTVERLSAVGVPAPETVATVLPHVQLACATAFVLGLLTPLSGTILAALGAGVLWLAWIAEPPLSPATAPAFLVLAVTACLLPAVHTGRLAVDHLAFSRPSSPRHRIAARRSPRTPPPSPKRPEEAPALPYPEEQAAVGRPSQT
ncbi:DoxX family protein [Allosalinactinospora lopnorensis]|uniref:DoxX family protein n=1 Tax=Allosalinactinospora lopnorensis TaxID=1352348 RepID=UPI0006987128|nr:DoxX family protein [Allosalinactinospora lopnorensis]